MSQILQKALSLLTGASVDEKRPLKGLSERDLIELEAEMGGHLFGPIPAGHRREFFCLDAHTWVWHEEWVDEHGNRQVTSTRYEIHQNGVLKAQNGSVYKFIEGDELRNLALSVRLYYEAVMRGIYKSDPLTGQPLNNEATATI